MPAVSRRSVLKGAGALAAWPVLTPAASTQPIEGPFRWGVASFDPTPTSVLLWTRVDPRDDGEPVSVTWSLAADQELTDVVASGSATADAEADHCVTVEAEDLPSGGVWWYAFATDDGRLSGLGRTRTMPADGDRLRLALVSCSRYATAGFGVYGALADREVDLVVHVGDYIYEDGGAGARAHDPPHELRTLTDYRTRYAQHRGDAELQRLHALHPMVAVWDDHELSGNSWRDGAPGHDPAQHGPWLDRVVSAGRARQEWLPGRTGVGDDGRLKAWRSLSLGDMAELVVMDTRSWGRDQQPATPDDLRSEGAARPRSLLGADQHAFVVERLAASDRPPWLLLANQVMFHPIAVPVLTDEIADAATAAGMLIADGAAINPDQWDGYPAARQAVSEAVGDRGGVVVLTGDIHTSWAWEGPAEADGGPAMVEVVTPATSSTTGADRFGSSVSAVEAGLSLTESDLSYVELSSNGYVIVDLGPDAVHAEWWHVDPSNAESQAFGAGRRASREPPMRFEPVEEPRPDPEPTTTTTETGRTTTTVEGAPSLVGRDGNDTPLFVGAGVAVVGAVVAALGLRRRRG